MNNLLPFIFHRDNNNKFLSRVSVIYIGKLYVHKNINCLCVKYNER